MIKTIANLLFILLFGVGCSSVVSEPYLYKGFSFKELGLKCNENKARNLSTEYALKKHPELIERISDDLWEHFNFKINEDSSTVYNLKTLFEYKIIKNEGSKITYFEESITVTMNEECETLTTEYFNGNQIATF